ncbi:MAG: DUF6273 domain-containing protein, partial [Ruminococcus sp.]|nr:DUF6273 domain-containing protein [Ruminococcus sp.]
YSGANQGNKKLANPVGLITADEVAYGGLVYATSSSGNYLDTDSHYWTMSPYVYPNAGVFSVHSNGHLSSNTVRGTNGVRPVINLKATVTLTGQGTSSNPYEVS